jgi:hypothetical protein
MQAPGRDVKLPFRRFAFNALFTAVILRSRALARRLEGWATTRGHPSRLAAKGGEHLRMTT